LTGGENIAIKRDAVLSFLFYSAKLRYVAEAMEEDGLSADDRGQLFPPRDEFFQLELGTIDIYFHLKFMYLV